MPEAYEGASVQSPQGPLNPKFLFVLLVVMVAAILGLSGYLYYKGSLSLPFLPVRIVNRVITEQPPASSDIIKNVPLGTQITCNSKKEENPIISEVVDPFTDLRIINISGRLIDIVFNTEEKTAKLKMTSLNGTQTNEFVLKDSELVYSKNGEAKLESLKFMDNLFIVLNCNPKGSETEFIVYRVYNQLE